MTRCYKIEFETLYRTIESGSARIHITETGPDGTAYAGFRDKILKAIKRLMTVVPGRQLIKNIEDGGFDVTIAHVVRGRLVHDDIANAAPLPGELPTFLVAHYLIGLTLAALYLLLAGRAAGNVRWAGLYGLATSGFAWLLMFPAMGYGAFGLHFTGTPIRTTAVFHLVFGLALALWWRVLARQ